MEFQPAEWMQLISWTGAALVIGAKGLDSFLGSLASIIKNARFLFDEVRAAHQRLQDQNSDKAP
ncbi:MAG: hypothetical protein L3J67_09485 [Hyphomicrobiaceae bacterium]|nr:hypothetical protein [Hyphomicrobiaceae bacterium]